MKNLTTVIAACLALAACATHKQPPPPPPAAAQAVAPPQAKPAETPPPAPPQTTGPSQAEIEAKALADQLLALKDKSVYFDFDKSLIKPEFQDAIQQQADFIKAHGNDVVTLEGNCDERGSDEYNLALGNRRADSVRNALGILGVSAQQMKTVSYGEERPRLTCHEEKCWKENRRVDFDHKLTP